MIPQSTTLTTEDDLIVSISSSGLTEVSYKCGGYTYYPFTSGGQPVLNTAALNLGKLPAGNQNCLLRGTTAAGTSISCSPSSYALSVSQAPYCTVTAVDTTLTASQNLMVNISSVGMSSISYSCNGTAYAVFGGATPVLNTSTALNMGLMPIGSHSCALRGNLSGGGTKVCTSPNPVTITVQ